MPVKPTIAKQGLTETEEAYEAIVAAAKMMY